MTKAIRQMVSGLAFSAAAEAEAIVVN